jgi:hypothetical protein
LKLLAGEERAIPDSKETVMAHRMSRMLMIAGESKSRSTASLKAAAYYREAVKVYRRTLAVGHPELTEAEQYYARFAKSLRKESIQASEGAP